MANELIIGKENVVSLVTDNPLGELIKPLSQEILLFETYVAGTTHINDTSVFENIKVGDRLILQREPQNRFDEKAILVLDSKKRKLGYVPRKDNTVFTRLMDAGKYLMAKIDKYEPMEDFKLINISIYMVDF